jgi:hypothetical protein
MYDKNNKPEYKTIVTDPYFKMDPKPLIWILLIFFRLLNAANDLFYDEAEVAHLETIAYENIRLKHQKAVNSWNNVKNLIGNQLIYIYIGIMIFVFKPSPHIDLIDFVLLC